MRIAEIFRSRQGEGLLTGVESTFIRTSGCNLRCWFCDTPYTSWEPEGDDLSVEEVVERAAGLSCPHVVLTGGEPMLHAELVPLSEELARRGHHITVETAGTLHLPVSCHLMSISPKLSNSAPEIQRHPRWHHRHESSRHRPQVIRRLVREYACQFKFVVDSPGDADEVQQYLATFPEITRATVLLMPQATTSEEMSRKSEWLRPLCERLGWQYCQREQISWYGLVRGT